MNYNNHPFPGTAGGTSFALAHNGVIHNDHTLRAEQGLPQTVVETDSYIAVQLLEREGAVDCSSLARVAELLQGTVALSVLDGENNCYLVKGNNPLCVYHWKKAGLFVYASTEQILLETFRIFTVPFGQPETVKLVDGEILKIDPIGRYSKSTFDTKNLSVPSHTYHNWPPYARFSICGSGLETHDPYVSALKSVAHWFGFSGDDVEMMLADGFTLEEIEEMFYDGYY
jgi:glucosamine 6-phosphate synthetase-like amidotransferase/phosphosugar isomerase protein